MTKHEENSAVSGVGSSDGLERYRHELDDDACCIHCGFDGAEWWHWKHNTYEGRASDAKEPLCTKRSNKD